MKQDMIEMIRDLITNRSIIRYQVHEQAAPETEMPQTPKLVTDMTKRENPKITLVENDDSWQ